MLRPTSGKVVFQGSDIYSSSALRRSRYRKQHVGFIFQKFFLPPYLTTFLSDENQRGRTIVLVSRDESLLRLGNRNVQLCAGRLSGAA